MTYFPASSFAEITPLFRGMRTVSWEFSVWSRINKNFLCFLVFWWDFGKYLFVFAGVSLRSTKNGTLIFVLQSFSLKTVTTLQGVSNHDYPQNFFSLLSMNYQDFFFLGGAWFFHCLLHSFWIHIVI